MSYQSSATLVFGLPLKDAEFVDKQEEEFFYELSATEDVEVFQSYDGESLEERILGVHLIRVEEGSTCIPDPIILMDKCIDAKRHLLKHITNIEDCNLYLVDSYL